MPYSKTPTISTYETKRVNFFQNPVPRNYLGTKDFRLVNMMVEAVPNPTGQSADVHLISRAKLTNESLGGAAGTPRGLFVFKADEYSVPATYAVVGNKLYNHYAPASITLSTSTGAVGWAEFLSSTGQKSLILVDGVDGYIILTNSVGVTTSITKITDPDFPSPHIPKPVVMDAYLFLAKPNTNDIYNSNLDHPELWTAGDFISAEMYADNIVALAKNNNYLYALGTDSVEFFYDAANPTGTPLARQPSAVQQMGCACANSVVQTEKQVVFVGTTSNGGFTVWVIDNFQAKEIGIPAVKSVLFQEAFENQGLENTVNAFVIRSNNQKLYVLRTPLRTFVYSFDTEMWHEWTSGRYSVNPVYNDERTFDGIYASGGYNGAPVIQTVSGGAYVMEDAGLEGTFGPYELMTCLIQTQRLNFDTINRKTMSRLSIIGDVLDFTNGDLRVQWSDDDGQTWTPTNGRILDLSESFIPGLPSIHQLGMFRQRSFRFRLEPGLDQFRILGMEVDINKGIR